jgi:hypothetical protein
MKLFKAVLHRFRFLLALMALSLAACSTAPTPQSYLNEKPGLVFDQYFNGTIDAWGVVEDRSGKVIRRFTVVIRCTWNGKVGTLDEDFVYSDGKKEKRVWTVTLLPNGKLEGTASDVVGKATGEIGGNALNWAYTMRLPVDDKTYDVQFDDWMWQIDDRVMINKAVMTKFGFKLADITITFVKRS